MLLVYFYFWGNKGRVGLLKWKIIIVLALVLTGCAKSQETREHSPVQVEQAVSFEIPLACPSKKNCWTVNTYPDHMPGPGLRDFTCGEKVQDDGIHTRFRLDTRLRYQSTVSVVAPAAGEVVGQREGMDDFLYEKHGLSAVKDKECGNGVMISHGNGLLSQVCHLKKGSVKVQKGDNVDSGQLLGTVGQSGFAGEPFLTFVVRYDGEKIDPFVGLAKTIECGLGEFHLWSDGALSKLGY